MTEPFILDSSFKGKLDCSMDSYPGGIVIPFNKELGWTSADAVRKVKFMLQRKFRNKSLKVGHAGTLDPLAQGVLLICVGKATKLAEDLQAAPKEYIAQVTVGATTPSFDREKEIDATYPYEHIDRPMVEKVLAEMTGEIDQVPPVFSAKMVDGHRAYTLARQGEDDTIMKPNRITVYENELLSFELPEMLVRIRCSKGTYIRAFARDLGRALNSGAYLSGLMRTMSGDFNIGKCLGMEQLEQIIKDI